MRRTPLSSVRIPETKWRLLLSGTKGSSLGLHSRLKARQSIEGDCIGDEQGVRRS